MAAGGFKEFVAGETLDQDEINDFLMQGVLVFAGTAARGSAIGTPVEGQFAFLKDSDALTYHDGSDWVEFSTAPGTATAEYVVVAGGGGGGRDRAGGGGGGGHLAGTASVQIGCDLYVSVGAGGVGGTLAGTRATLNGNFSQFYDVLATGGGAGSTLGDIATQALIGGSGGGGYGQNLGGSWTGGASGVAGQGNAGGNGINASPGYGSGGGGGAGATGGNGSGSAGGAGGNGVANSITGTSVTRAGGGGGGTSSGSGGAGGTGGGGAGGASGVAGTAGTVNTGGGGGGGGGSSALGGAGGSGVVILRYADTLTITLGAGLTGSTATDGSFKVTTITAGSDFVRLN